PAGRNWRATPTLQIIFVAGHVNTSGPDLTLQNPARKSNGSVPVPQKFLHAMARGPRDRRDVARRRDVAAGAIAPGDLAASTASARPFEHVGRGERADSSPRFLESRRRTGL